MDRAIMRRPVGTAQVPSRHAARIPMLLNLSSLENAPHDSAASIDHCPTVALPFDSLARFQLLEETVKKSIHENPLYQATTARLRLLSQALPKTQTPSPPPPPEGESPSQTRRTFASSIHSKYQPALKDPSLVQALLDWRPSSMPTHHAESPTFNWDEVPLVEASIKKPAYFRKALGILQPIFHSIPRPNSRQDRHGGSS